MKMSKLLEKAYLPIGFILMGVVVLFSLHPAWLHKLVPLRIYKPVELLSIALLISAIIVVSWNYFKDRDTGKVPPWSITTFLGLLLITGLFFWKGNPLKYFPQKTKLAQNNNLPDSSKSNTGKSDKKTTPTKLTQVAIDSAKNATLTKEQQEEVRLAELEKKLVEEKELFKKDSLQKVEAADRQCKRDKRYEQLSIEIDKIKKAREVLANQPVIANCGDQISTPKKEKETTRIAATKLGDRKKHKKTSSTFGPPVASGTY